MYCFLLNCLYFLFLKNNTSVRVNTSKGLVIDKDVFNIDKNSENRTLKSVKKIFKPHQTMQRSPQPWDGCDCRKGWEVSEETFDIDELDKKTRTSVYFYKMALLKKLQSDQISQAEKLDIIKKYPEIFDKSPMASNIGSLFRGLDSFEFTDFYIQDI